MGNLEEKELKNSPLFAAVIYLGGHPVRCEHVQTSKPAQVLQASLGKFPL